MTIERLERAERELDEIRSELDQATRDKNDAKHAIFALVEMLAEHLPPHAAAKVSALEHISDALDDMFSDATAPLQRKLTAAEDAVGDLERTDLNRSSPVVL